jgi:uncharacterized membrane protein YhaH (DUF805 family)
MWSGVRLLLTSVRYNLARLVVFSGREGLALFWPYAAGVLVLLMVAMQAVILPSILDTMVRMQRFAAQHPDQATVTSGPGSYSISIRGDHPELMPDFHPFFGAVTVGVVAVIILLAAAVSRRLHDRGRTALWAVLPLPFLTFGLARFGSLFDGAKSGRPFDLPLFFLLFANNFVYLAMLAVLGWHLIRPSMPGPNRFGDSVSPGA